MFVAKRRSNSKRTLVALGAALLIATTFAGPTPPASAGLPCIALDPGSTWCPPDAGDYVDEAQAIVNEGVATAYSVVNTAVNTAYGVINSLPDPPTSGEVLALVNGVVDTVLDAVDNVAPDPFSVPAPGNCGYIDLGWGQ